MSRKPRLAALAIVALIGAGCSNGSAEDGDTGTGNSSGSSGGNENATIGDRTVRFAACMRENGVTEFPDPNASGDQEFADAIERVSSRDPAAWQRFALTDGQLEARQPGAALRTEGVAGGPAAAEVADHDRVNLVLRARTNCERREMRRRSILIGLSHAPRAGQHLRREQLGGHPRAHSSPVMPPVSWRLVARGLLRPAPWT